MELLHFPYDENSRSKKLSPKLAPSKANWNDMNIPWDSVQGSWEDMAASERFEEILAIIGATNRKDALHVDTAHKADCDAMVTVDDDILSKRDQLKGVTGLDIFHPIRDEKALRDFVLRDDA